MICEKGRFRVLFRRKFIPNLHVKYSFLEDILDVRRLKGKEKSKTLKGSYFHLQSILRDTCQEFSLLRHFPFEFHNKC